MLKWIFGLMFLLTVPPVLAQAHTTEPAGILEGPQAPGAAPARTPDSAMLSNDAVVRMVKAGLGPELIVQTINTQPGSYDTGVDGLIALKKDGVPEPVISAMISSKRRQITGAAPVVLAEVNEPGVYYKDRQGRWTLMETEIVHVKSGGFIKSTLTNGIIKQDRNGAVSGQQSKLVLPQPIEFMIYAPDGVAAEEYDLLQFRLNSKDREFRTLTGGVFHSTGGAKRDEVPFTAVKMAPHTYTFSTPAHLPGGEYGILPPGTGNITNGGKIYTFAITE